MTGPHPAPPQPGSHPWPASADAALEPDRPWYRRLAWLAVLIIGVAAYIAVLLVMVATQNANFFPSLLLIGSATVPSAVLMLAWGSGRQLRVRPGTVALTAIAGGLIGTLCAGVLEYDVLRSLKAAPMLMVGLIEESAKMIVPLIVLLIGRQRGPGVGVIIGVASGMGFATLETMGYGFNALLAGGGVSAVDSTLLLRALLAPAGHVAWTGMTCAAMWHLAETRHKGRGVALLLGAFVAAVALHALWDGSTNLIIHIGVVLISIAILLTLIIRGNLAGRRQVH